MAVILTTSRRVRFYSVDCLAVVQAWLDLSTRDRSIQVGIGVWISTDRARNTKEITTAVNLAKQYYGRASIIHINVGTEAILRGDVIPADIVGYLRSARAQLGAIRVPITYADDVSTLLRAKQDWLPSICQNVDTLYSNTFAFYLEGYVTLPTTNPTAFGQQAAQLTQDYLNRLNNLCPKVCAGEILWPTKSLGPTPNNNQVSPAISRAFFCAWKQLAARNGQCYFWHEAIDGLIWRQASGELEYQNYMGIYDNNGKFKYSSWC